MFRIVKRLFVWLLSDDEEDEPWEGQAMNMISKCEYRVGIFNAECGRKAVYMGRVRGRMLYLCQKHKKEANQVVGGPGS